MAAVMMLVTATPAVAVAPPGSLNVPGPPDWGVLEGMRSVQENESAALGNQEITLEATDALAGVVALDYGRESPVGPFSLHRTAPPPVQEIEALPLVETSPYTNLTNFLDILFDQPLMVMIMVRSGEHVNWVEASLRPTLGFEIENGIPRFINWQRWEEVDVDNDTTTGDAQGNDLRIRLVPVVQYKNRSINLLPPEFKLQLRGGLAVEMERLGTGAEDRPIDTTFIKAFRYNNINYTWFIEYKIDRIPGSARLSITADQVNVSGGGGNVLDLIRAWLNGTIANGTNLGDIAGPYLIDHETSDAYTRIQASLGYLKIRSDDPTGPAELDESSWLTAHVRPADDDTTVPRHFSLWLDSPSFNRSFDHLNWTADKPAVLDLEYFDDRANDTQARGLIDAIPENLHLEIDNVTEDVGSVSKIHLTATRPIKLVQFDEWEFAGSTRKDYLHSHVELEDVPEELWLNGTLDIGGKAFDPLDPDPTVTSFIPQLMDALMVRLASKLFTIGRTVRSLPQNVLNMPDRQGYTDLNIPDEDAFLGKLELWLTSDHYVLVEEGIDFFAFYNDSVDPVGPMVQTGFSARLMDIRSFHATFVGKKQVVLDSRYNRELRALFIDEKNSANASLWFSNIPHNISLELLDEELVYMGDGTVDQIKYTSEIGNQYIRMVMEGVPGGLRVHQGDETTGITALIGAIDSLDVQVTNGQARRMLGDHLMVEIDPEGTTAASAHITGLRSLVYEREPVNHITLTAEGEPFKVLISDRSRAFEMRALLDPLPGSIDVEASDVLGLGDIGIPSLNELTSVLDFASVIYAVSELGEDVITSLGDVSTTLVEGLGTFSSDFAFQYEGDTGMDLVATVKRTGQVMVEPVPWVHGVTANMVPDGSDVLVDAKVYLTGLGPVGSIGLNSSKRRSALNLTMEGFAPVHDHLMLSLEGASMIEGGGGKDVFIFVSDLRSPMDIDLHVDIVSDLRVGGTSKGDVNVVSSQAMGPLHVRMRTRDEVASSVELLISGVPELSTLSFSYSSEILVSSGFSEGVDFVFLKLSRDLRDGIGPASTLILHDLPTLMSLETGPGSDYDMDADSPLANLPKATVTTNEPGLDLLVDLDGRAMGNKADLYLDVRDVTGLSLKRSGDEYRISAQRLGFIHVSVRNLVYTDTTWMDRIDLAAESIRQATIKVHMVFGVYPLIDVDNLRAGGIQLTLEGTLGMGDESYGAHISMFEVPMSLTGLPRSHSNGVATREADDAHMIFIPAPMTTLMGTLLD